MKARRSDGCQPPWAPGRRPSLPYRHANELAPPQTEAPRKIFRPADTDAGISHNLDVLVDPTMKAVPGITAKIGLMMSLCNIERLRQLPRPGTESTHFFNSASLTHQRNPTARLDRANQNDAVTRASFDEDVEHPMDAVVEIDISGTGFVSANKFTRARSAEGVTRFVAFHQISLGLNDDAGAPSPDQLRADQLRGTGQGINFKEIGREHPTL